MGCLRPEGCCWISLVSKNSKGWLLVLIFLSPTIIVIWGFLSITLTLVLTSLVAPALIGFWVFFVSAYLRVIYHPSVFWVRQPPFVYALILLTLPLAAIFFSFQVAFVSPTLLVLFLFTFTAILEEVIDLWASVLPLVSFSRPVILILGVIFYDQIDFLPCEV